MRHYLWNTIGASRWIPNRARSVVMRVLGCDVGRGSTFREGLTFRRGAIKFGRNVYINGGCIFDPGSSYILVEDGAGLAPNVVLAATTHDFGQSDKRAGHTVSSPIVIGRGSWLATGVIVLPGVTVAPGCIIGAGAVVTRDTEPDGVYIGAPARRVRDLEKQLSA